MKAWPWAAGFLFLLWAGLAGFLFIRSPLLVNPFLMAEKLAANEIENNTLALYSAFVPILFDTVLFLFLVLILFFVDRMLVEKRYLQWIEGAQKRERG